MGELENLRKSLSSDTTTLLQQIWSVYSGTGKWPSKRSLHAKFGRTSTLNALDATSGSFVLDQYASGSSLASYELTLLGCVMADGSMGALDLLVRLLGVLRDEYMRNPEVAYLDSTVVGQATGMTSQDLARLGWLLRLGDNLRWWGGGSWGDESWQLRVADAVDELPEVENMREWLEHQLVEKFDPNLPVPRHERDVYFAGKYGSTATQRDVLAGQPSDQLDLSKMSSSTFAYDAFLSHASSDAAEAAEIYSKATSAGYSLFLAPKQLKPGDDFEERIRMALRGSQELWILVSPSSLSSEWVLSEWGAAWILDKRVVPILHRCEPKALPPRLARLQCIDLHRVEDAIRLLARYANERGQAEP